MRGYQRRPAKGTHASPNTQGIFFHAAMPEKCSERRSLLWRGFPRLKKERRKPLWDTAKPRAYLSLCQRYLSADAIATLSKFCSQKSGTVYQRHAAKGAHMHFARLQMSQGVSIHPAPSGGAFEEQRLWGALIVNPHFKKPQKAVWGAAKPASPRIPKISFHRTAPSGASKNTALKNDRLSTILCSHPPLKKKGTPCESHRPSPASVCILQRPLQRPKRPRRKAHIPLLFSPYFLRQRWQQPHIRPHRLKIRPGIP